MNNSFVFYATFWETYLSLKNGEREELAARFLEEVCRYGITGAYNEGDAVIDALMKQTVFGIDAATKRYLEAKENGNKGGAPKKYNVEAIMEYLNSGHTQQEAADRFGCTVRTIQRYVNAQKDIMKNIINSDGSFNF